LAYNCSPSFNWKEHLGDPTIATFQRELGALGYTFQFITLAGWHTLNLRTFELAHAYAQEGMSAYVALQKGVRPREGRLHRHPAPAQASTGALGGSTEAEQFHG
jgi:isocitrate lyase